MKMTGKKWAFIGALIFVAAIVALYIPYNSNKNEQGSLQQQINVARQMVLARTLSKNSVEQKIQKLEADIATAEGVSEQLQDELDQLQQELLQLENEREQAVQEAIALLNATEAKFLNAAESIEYGELLFTLANSAQIKLSQVDYTDSGSVNIGGVDYDVVLLNLAVNGKKADILDYLVKIQTNTAFNTSLFDQVNIQMPKLLTDDEKNLVFNLILEDMVAKGIEDLTVDEICDFIVLGIEDVTGNYIQVKDVETMAAKIKELLNELMTEEFDDPLVSTLTEDYDDLLASKLAEMIKQHIDDLLTDTVVNTLATRIAEALENGDSLEGIVGEDIATLLGSQLVGALPSDIAALLKEFISECISNRMVDYVTPHVFQNAQKAANEKIAELETTSNGNIEIAIYVYNTSQEGK
jgi:hypothetical protein